MCHKLSQIGYIHTGKTVCIKEYKTQVPATKQPHLALINEPSPKLYKVDWLRIVYPLGQLLTQYLLSQSSGTSIIISIILNIDSFVNYFYVWGAQDDILKSFVVVRTNTQNIQYI